MVTGFGDFAEPMLTQDIITTKRDGGALSDEQIAFFVEGLTTGAVAAEQASALAMAIFFRGMSFEEASSLTRAMARSGTIIDWSGEKLGGPVVDKHSTGGVGDKVSLMLAPIAAACGAYVPMISGRGLGHTGGTLDKMDAIPGYVATPDLSKFKQVVREVGCAIIGQTGELAPADRRLYAIRDVTGTVESIPLITASILSKKLAAGLDGLVMDVKTGSGAFMKTREDSVALAKSLIGTGAAAGLKVHALITDMSEPLGRTAGNALEVYELFDYLANTDREARLDDCVLSLAAEMLLVGGLAADREEGRRKSEDALTSGKAAEIFARMIAALGGPSDLLEKPAQYLAKAPVVEPVFAAEKGHVTAVDNRAVGIAIIELGGGRRRVEDRINPAVGFADFAPIGAEVGPDQPIAMVHAADKDAAKRGAEALRKAYFVDAKACVGRKVVDELLTAA